MSSLTILILAVAVICSQSVSVEKYFIDRKTPVNIPAGNCNLELEYPLLHRMEIGRESPSVYRVQVYPCGKTKKYGSVKQNVLGRGIPEFAVLTAILQEITDPKSPTYGKYLTLEQLGQLTAPSAETIDRISK